MIGFGLAALLVLALAVGWFDVTQSGRLRAIARERRAAWELRRRDEHAPTVPDQDD
jgi:hypothetical protein